MDKKVTKSLNLDKLENYLEHINIEKDIQNILRQNKYKTERNHKNNNPKSPGRKSANTLNNQNQKEVFESKNISNKHEDNKKRVELMQELEYLQAMYIKNFIEDSKIRTDAEAKSNIHTEGENFKTKVELVVKKAEEELNSYLQKLESIELKNKELITNINMVEKNKHYLENQLNDAEISVNKINKKYEIFNDLKPYYDELVSEFNIDKDNYKPKDKLLSTDMKKRRNEAEEFNSEIKERREKMKMLVESKKKEDFDNRKKNEDISSDLREIELKNRNIEDEYNDKFMKIKENIDSLYKYKEENIKIRNSFVSVYNLFFPKLYLERDLNIHPKGIDLIKTDYTPKTYETDECIKYIYLMLRNSTEDSTGRLLREIVSYCNMMLRKTRKGYEKIYYEPISTVKQIESLINSIEAQNEELKSVINSYTKINNKNQEKINKLDLEIKRIEKMHEILHNKMRDFYKKNKRDLSDTFGESKSIAKALEQDIKKDLDKKDINKKYKIKEVSSKFIPDYKTKKKEKNLFRTKTEVNSEKDKNIYSTNQTKDEFSQGAQQFIEHANRLFFYQSHINMKPRDSAVFIKAHKRMQQKLNRLKKIEQNSDKFSSVEKAVINTLNNHIDNLVGELKALGN